MFKIISKIVLAGCGLLLASTVGNAQNSSANCTDDAMLVFDGSGSMAAVRHNGLARPRIEEARKAIEKSIPQVTPFRKMGLVIFGPGPEDSCSNIDLRFKPQSDAAPRIIADVNGLSPIGETPLTDAVKIAVDALDVRNKPGVVVLLTDGRESCRRDPCVLASQLAAEKTSRYMLSASRSVLNISNGMARGPGMDEQRPAALQTRRAASTCPLNRQRNWSRRFRKPCRAP